MTREQYRRTTYWTAGLCALALAAVSVRLVAQNIDGAIFTTTGDGTVVNENTRYGAKSEVYLNGGPQNHRANGLPDGNYYFMITDPSGAVLLSSEDIKCRVAVVANGRFAGVPADDVEGYGNPACYHNVGALNPANGSLPVQMCAATGCPGALPGGAASYYDTTNPGGEYKAWITPVAMYDDPNDAVNVCGSSNNTFGFCNSRSKTDNFKVRQGQTQYADITVCKFNDLNGDGIQDLSEPLIPHWPITATGVNGGPVDAQTGDDGCVTFTYSGFNAGHTEQQVTLTEGSFGTDWTRTAPADGTDGNFTMSGGVISVVLKAGDDLKAPDFGNTNPYCQDGCVLNTLVVTKTAFPSLTRTFTWDIEKSVDQTSVKAVGGSDVEFKYTVSVTHDAGTDSNWKVTGVITVANPGGDAVTASVTDAVGNGGQCTVDDGASVLIAAGSHVERNYTCTYASLPADGVNTATATTDLGNFSGNASIDFDAATIATVDETAVITDSLGGGLLGSVSSTDVSPRLFTYSNVVTAPSGTCLRVNNTATFTTNDTPVTDSASQAVEVCGGVDLTVSKTAATTFTRTYDWSIGKRVDKTLVQQNNGTTTFNYTVDATSTGSVDSAWTVSGTITVTNPNDWQSVEANLADALDGAACTVTGGSVTVEPDGSALAAYSCTFTSAPAAAGTNTATATWDATAAYTASSSATGTAGYTFGAPTTEVNKTVTVTDTFNGTTTTLGTVTSPGPQSFPYSQTVPNAVGGQCATYNNTAVITQTGQSSSQTVNVCNTATGGLTIGFWQNRNGQAAIKAANQSALNLFLMQYAPFQDLGTQVIATYVTNVIKAANASGASMNAMLKAQMLATALDVFTSTTGLGNVKIDLTSVNKPIGSLIFTNASSSFGPANSLTVLQMLTYAASRSNIGGSIWYGQVKNGLDSQELAKDAFDAINNQVAWIAP